MNDLVVKEKDILHDKSYIRRYYPMDGAIRNKNNLTLASPHYVAMSKFFKFVKEKTHYALVDGNNELPDESTIKSSQCS